MGHLESPCAGLEIGQRVVSTAWPLSTGQGNPTAERFQGLVRVSALFGEFYIKAIAGKAYSGPLDSGVGFTQGMLQALGKSIACRLRTTCIQCQKM